MFTKVHYNETFEDKRDAVYLHLYECNIKQLIKERKVITDIWKEICRETAQADVRDIVLSGNLEGYYKRLKAGAI